MYDINDLNAMSFPFNNGIYNDIKIKAIFILNTQWRYGTKDYKGVEGELEELSEFISFLVEYDITYVTLNGVILVDHDDYIKIMGYIKL